jgi:hypothetical protein
VLFGGPSVGHLACMGILVSAKFDYLNEMSMLGLRKFCVHWNLIGGSAIVQSEREF